MINYKYEDIEKKILQIFNSYEFEFADKLSHDIFKQHLVSVLERAETNKFSNYPLEEYSQVIDELSSLSLDIANEISQVLYKFTNVKIPEFEKILFATHIQNQLNKEEQ